MIFKHIVRAMAVLLASSNTSFAEPKIDTAIPDYSVASGVSGNL